MKELGSEIAKKREVQITGDLSDCLCRLTGVGHDSGNYPTKAEHSKFRSKLRTKLVMWDANLAIDANTSDLCSQQYV